MAIGQGKKIKVQFVGIGYEQLSIGLLSAMAKRAGYEVSLAFGVAMFNDRWVLEMPLLGRIFDDTRDVLRQIEKTKPDVLAFSPLTGTYQWMLRVAREAKKILPQVKTVFGGVHVSAIPERVIKKKEVDFVVVGEGELAFLEILKHIEENGEEKAIPNTLYINPQGKLVRGPQKACLQNLDELPFYDKIIWEEYIKINEKYMIMVSRGCPFRCAFCFNSFFASLCQSNPGKYVRFRSVDHVMGELLWAKQRYKRIGFIDFQDDNFTADRKWLKEFLKKYKKELSLPFQCLTRAEFIDEEIIKWLSDAGCAWIQMGVQSADDEYKERYLQRYEKLKNIARARDLIKKYGINLKFDHILALPNEPFSAQEKALRFYARYTPTRIQAYWGSYYPGTKMLKDGLRDGLVTKQEAERLYEGIGFSIFRSGRNIPNLAAKKLYKRYLFIFRIMPLLPSRLRVKINPGNIRWLPSFIAGLVAFLADIITSRNNPEFILYKKHFFFQLKRYFYKKFTGRNIKAVRPQ